MPGNNHTEKPIISVVTVVRNNAAAIDKTITSVVDQDYLFKEYIVVDGASTDGTLDLIAVHQKKIDSIISEPDRGIYDAMNKGLRKCTGELVLFLNSGDYLADNTVLSRISEIYFDNPGIALVFGSILLNYSRLNITKKINRDLTRDKLKRGQQPPHPASFIKRSILVELNGFNTDFTYSADFDLYCRLIQKDYPHIVVDLPVAVFQSGGSSAHFTARIETFHVIKKYFGLHNALSYLLLKILESIIKIILDLTGVLSLIHRVKKRYSKKA